MIRRACVATTRSWTSSSPTSRSRSSAAARPATQHVRRRARLEAPAVLVELELVQEELALRPAHVEPPGEHRRAGRRAAAGVVTMIPTPSGPSSHLWPSATRASTPRSSKRSGSTPSPWMASRTTTIPRSCAAARQLGDRRDPAGVERDPREREHLDRRHEQRHAPSRARSARRGCGKRRTATPRRLQGEVGRDVGGELLLADQHRVALPPGKPLRDQREALGGAAHQGDVLAARQPTSSAARARAESSVSCQRSQLVRAAASPARRSARASRPPPAAGSGATAAWFR